MVRLVTENDLDANVFIWMYKQPVTNNVIITEDKWFQNASEIVSYLKEHFNHDPSKEHHHTDAASLAECRKLEGNEHIIKSS